MPVTAAAAAPFAEGRWLFSHNGVVRGWPASVAALAAALPVTDLLTLDAPTDCRAAVGAGARTGCARARTRPTRSPTSSLEVAAAAPGSRLNLLLTDGATVWATAWTHALSVRAAARARCSSRPNPSTTTPAGRGPRPAPRGRPPRRAGPPDRRLDARRRRNRCAGVARTIHLTDARRRGRAARRRPGRPDRAPEEAAAEVVLRRPRQRAVRGDHPAARVLPDPHRAGPAGRRASTRSPRSRGADTLVELGSGSSEKTRLLLDALRAAHGGAAPRTCRRT